MYNIYSRFALTFLLGGLLFIVHHTDFLFLSFFNHISLEVSDGAQQVFTTKIRWRKNNATVQESIDCIQKVLTIISQIRSFMEGLEKQIIEYMHSWIIYCDHNVTIKCMFRALYGLKAVRITGWTRWSAVLHGFSTIC